MNEPRCECCDLLVSSCGKQGAERQRKENLKLRAELVKKGWFTPRFPGTCAECNDRFTPEGDQLIHALGVGYGYKGSKYVADCCAHTLEPLAQ